MTGLSDSRVARRYAAALYATAERLGRVDTVAADLDAILSAWRSDGLLRRVLESPHVTTERKIEVLTAALQNADVVTTSFVKLLVGKRRTDVLPVVRELYSRLSDAKLGIVRADATVAAPLSDADREALIGALRRQCGQDVRLSVRVEPAILGGITVRMGDTVLDGSVRGALERIRTRLLSGGTAEAFGD